MASAWVATQIASMQPKGLWLLDELTGTAAADQIARNPATYAGTVTLGQAALIPDADGFAVLLGADGRVSVPHSSDFQIAADWTFAGWFGPRSLSVEGTLFHKGDWGVSGQQGMAVLFYTTGQLRVGWFNGSWGSADLGISIPAGESFFVSLRYAATAHRLHVRVNDTTVVATLSTPLFQSGVTQPLRIGCSITSGSPGTCWAAKVDSIVWFDRFISDEELDRFLTKDATSDTYVIEGVTRLDGNPVAATVRLYENESGEFRAETQSNPANGYYSFEAAEGAMEGDALWSNVQLLCYFEGQVGSYSFPDEARKLSIYPDPYIGSSEELRIAAGGPFNLGYLPFPGRDWALLQVSRAQLPPIGVADFCLEYWIMPLNGGHGDAWPRHVQIGRNTDTDGVFNITGYNLDSPSKLHVQKRAGNAWVDLFTPNLNASMPSALPNGAWSHIAVGRRNGTFFCYVNGVSAGTGNADAYAITKGTMFIGGGWDSFNECFYGGLGPLRLTVGVSRYTENFTPERPQSGPLRSSSSMAAGEQYFVLCHYGEGVRPLAHGPVTPLVIESAQAPSDPLWGNVVILLHCDGANDSTAFSDEKGTTITPVGDAKQKTAQQKFGLASAYFDGTGDGLSLPISGGLGAGDFTVEMWVRPAATGGYRALFFAPGYGLYISGGSLIWYQGSARCSISTVATDQWSHVAVVRQGSTVYTYLNGAQSAASYTSTTDYSAGTWRVGVNSDGSEPFDGYIDDIRITKGVARYTAAFTPPAEAFPHQAADLWVPSATGMAAWLDADDAASLTVSGSNITAWRDKSGNSRNALASATWPTIEQNALAGNPLVVFNGSNQHFSLENTIPITSQMTVFEVFVRPAAGALTVNLGGVSSNAPPYALLWATDNVRYSALFASDQVYSTHGTALTSVGAFMSCLVRGSDISLFMNGSVVGSAQTANAIGTTVLSYIGRRATNYNGGKLAEIIVFPSALSATDRQKIEGYLAWKWGLFGNLPNDHPYKAAPPLQ